MQVISEVELQKNKLFFAGPIKDDIVITREDKPFAVVIDYKKYKNFTQVSENTGWLDETFGIINQNDLDNLLDDIYNSRINKEI